MRLEVSVHQADEEMLLMCVDASESIYLLPKLPLMIPERIHQGTPLKPHISQPERDMQTAVPAKPD